MTSTRRSLPKGSLAVATPLLLGTLWCSSALGATIIKQPGLHPRYDFEFEPHLVLAFDDPFAYHSDTGIGLGARFDVPLMHQGPISTINNNMALGFGLDFVHYQDCDGESWTGTRDYVYDCSGNGLFIPFVLQWNFYITDLITVFGEPGIGIRYSWLPVDAAWAGNPRGSNTDSDLDALPVLETGAKFMFGKTAGLTVRLGYPHFTVGGSFLF
jgi:hypothetical protein